MMLAVSQSCLSVMIRKTPSVHFDMSFLTLNVGFEIGFDVGNGVGKAVMGFCVGALVGFIVGFDVGLRVGCEKIDLIN